MYGDPSEPDPEVRGVERDMPHYTREWRFDPYHQGLRYARRHDPEHVDGDTEWTVWEVFQQERRGEHHKHVGSLHAPDAEMALVLAKENFVRRGKAVNLWVARAEDIFATAYEDADIFEHTTDKMYREPGGFHGLRKRGIHGKQAKRDEQAEARPRPPRDAVEAAAEQAITVDDEEDDT